MAQMWVSMGPQHPMTHGLWRLRVRVDGEIITEADPDMGWLHRSVEKLTELYEYPFNTIFTDRLCYASPLTWSHCYVAAVEDLMGVEVPERARYMRVIVLELQRILSHLMWFAAYGPDLGLFAAAVYGFREREDFMDRIQELTGQRLNYNYLRIGGLKHDFPPGWTDRLLETCDRFLPHLEEYKGMCENNSIFRMRTQGVGILPAKDAMNLGVTGPNLRASGVDYDARVDNPYEAYGELDFPKVVATEGDCYARFVVRLYELEQSVGILRQAIKQMPDKGKYRARAPRNGPKCDRVFDGTGVARVEDSRGEAMFYVIGQGNEYPYRVKIRSPAYTTIGASPVMLVGSRVADIPVILGSIDMCIGETDK